MGIFKDMLERALAETNQINKIDSNASIIARDYQKEFTELLGQPVIWTTKNNVNLRAPQLVVIEQVFPHFVLVVKTSYSVEGERYLIRYGIPYQSLYCNLDVFENLDFIEPTGGEEDEGREQTL